MSTISSNLLQALLLVVSSGPFGLSAADLAAARIEINSRSYQIEVKGSGAVQLATYRACLGSAAECPKDPYRHVRKRIDPLIVRRLLELVEEEFFFSLPDQPSGDPLEAPSSFEIAISGHQRRASRAVSPALTGALRLLVALLIPDDAAASVNTIRASYKYQSTKSGSGEQEVGIENQRVTLSLRMEANVAPRQRTGHLPAVVAAALKQVLLSQARNDSPGGPFEQLISRPDKTRQAHCDEPHWAARRISSTVGDAHWESTQLSCQPPSASFEEMAGALRLAASLACDGVFRHLFFPNL